jgi:hypothetical protein
VLELVEVFNPKAIARKIKAIQRKHWLALKDHDDKAVATVQKMLTELEKQLKAEIGSLSAESFKSYHLGRVEHVVNDLLADFENRASNAIRMYVPDAMRMNQNYWWDMTGAMRHMKSIPYPIPIVLPDSVLSSAATLSSEMIKGLAAEVRKQTVAALTKTVLGTQTPFETARQLSTIIGSRGGIGAFASAERIVRTEIGRAYSVADEFFIEGSLEHRPADLPRLYKAWISMDDARVRPSHAAMHKVAVPADETFSVPIVKMIKGTPVPNGTEQMSGPRDMGASAGNVINCRCTMVTIPEDILEETLAGFPGEPEPI